MSSKRYVGFTGGVSIDVSAADYTVTREPRGIQVGVSGDVELEYPDGSVVVWPACVAGMPLPYSGFVKVLSANTTATGIVVGY